MTYNYKPKGVCAQQISVTIENGKIENVEFFGGCPGNLIGISRLVKGKRPEEVISELSGTRCGFRATSCPDQLTYALKAAMDTMVAGS